MRYTHEIKRHVEKATISITVSVSLSYGSTLYMDVDVLKREFRKRKFISVVDTDCYRYRGLSMEDRKLYRMKKYLEVVSCTEMNEAKQHLLQRISDAMGIK